jgi:heterodisulfide reductase subunit C
MVAQYKMKTFNLMQDVKNAPAMFLKGKLSLMPHTVKNKEAIRKMFERAEARSNGGGEH